MRKREWEKCTDPERMLRDLRGPPGPNPVRDRRARVFTLTAGRPALARVDHPACDWAAGLAWRLAEGISTPSTLDEAASCRDALRGVCDSVSDFDSSELARLAFCLLALLGGDPHRAAHVLVTSRSLIALGEATPLLTPAETAACCGLLREIFGDRGRTLVDLHAWLTSTVVALARGVYDEEAFDRLPVLADALAEAGCGDPDVLTHCRGPGPHVRGCWVVDALLGKGMT